MARACFRFYAELNVFLKPHYRQRLFTYPCSQDATVKHMIEALGVPHTEVEWILVNGQEVNFSYLLQDADHVSVYPWFSTLPRQTDFSISLHAADKPRFVADAHLGRLARDLRMLGFDVIYRNDFSDADIVRLAVEENRIVLTRDRDLLVRKAIEKGCYLYTTATESQLKEVIARYRLADRTAPLSRCLKCNGLLQPIAKSVVHHHLPQRTREWGQHFFMCSGCGQVYWEGSHVARMKKRVACMLEPMQADGENLNRSRLYGLGFQ